MAHSSRAMASIRAIAFRRAVSSLPQVTSSIRLAAPARASLPAPRPCNRGALKSLRSSSSTSALPRRPTVYPLLDKATSSWQYVVADPATSTAVVIDPVLDYDPASGHVSTGNADQLLAFLKNKGLRVTRILETHAHADHLTSSQYLKDALQCEGQQASVCIGSRIREVQRTFAKVYGFDAAAFDDTFDVYLADEEEFDIGGMRCRVIHLPGHTPDHVGYVIGDSIFTGDSIFLPDVGSARVDFPGGDAKALYSSMRRLLAFPEDYRLYVGHDYPEGRPHEAVATVGENCARNKHVGLAVSEDEFVRFREARDAVLGTPRLLHPALQVNIRAGKLPPADESGRVFLKVPVLGSKALAARIA